MLLRKGDEGPAVRSVQDMLRFLGFVGRNGKPLAPDGVFGEQTEHAVLNFQETEGLLRDGVVGPTTMGALEKAWTARSIELNSPGPDAFDGMPDRLMFVRVKADLFDGQGYDRLFLRSDVASAYEKVYETTHNQGGMLTSSGGVRSLDATVNPSRSVTSMHYVGRALDLFIYSGMVNPQNDAYVVSREAPLTYRVYARCTRKRNRKALLPEEKTVENVITYESFKTDALRRMDVRDRFVDLTALFEEHGFMRIRGRPLFEQGRSMMGAEWWHFQYEKGLIPGVTTFGSELLKVYSRKTLEDKPPYQYRDRVFGINWF